MQRIMAQAYCAERARPGTARQLAGERSVPFEHHRRKEGGSGFGRWPRLRDTRAPRNAQPWAVGASAFRARNFSDETLSTITRHTMDARAFELHDLNVHVVCMSHTYITVQGTCVHLRPGMRCKLATKQSMAWAIRFCSMNP